MTEKQPQEILSIVLESKETGKETGEETGDETTYKKALRKIDLRLVLVYSIAYVLTNINKQNISNTAILNLEAGHGIKQQLGNLSSSQWAWCISIFYYPYLFFEPIFTVLSKKVTPKLWQSRIMITWGIISMTQAATHNYGGILAVRFLLGLMESSFYTSVLYHFSFWYKPRELPKRISFFYAFGMLSGAFSGILAYGISHLDGKRHIGGWRWVFIFEGIPTIIVGIYCMFYLPNFIEDSKFLNDNEKNSLLLRMPKSSPKKADKFFIWTQFKQLLAMPTFYSYTVIWMFQGVGGWGISFVLPTIIFELGFTDTAKTQLMTMPPSLVGFALLNIVGYLIHKKYLKAFPTATSLSFLQIICYIVLISTNSAPAKYAMLTIATAISNSLYPILWPDRIRIVRGATCAGFAIGWTNSMAQFMGILGPIVYQSKFGPKYHVSYGTSIGLCSVSFLAILVTWYLVKKSGILDSEGDGIDDDKSIFTTTDQIQNQNQ